MIHRRSVTYEPGQADF